MSRHHPHRRRGHLHIAFSSFSSSSPFSAKLYTVVGQHVLKSMLVHKSSPLEYTLLFPVWPL